ncbi:hypothetical protein BGZ79_010825 [Entomortierella chlamydospora]|nr:hypothetical protein BGZ79_010825 [Entomortierella chlamydospora]
MLSSNVGMKLSSSMQAKRLLRGQWRPALMLATVMASITVFWLFYYIDAHRLSGLSSNTLWVQEWVVCLLSSSAKGLSSDQTQSTCAELIKDNVPSLSWFGAAESLVAILGIVASLVFVSKMEFWSEWANTIHRHFGRDKQERHGDLSRTHESGNPPVMGRRGSSHYQYNDPNMKKGTRIGYNDELPRHVHRIDNKPLPGHDEFEAQQWYDMDALLDREYDLQDTNQQGNTSYGSRPGVTPTSGRMPSTEPPHYLASASQDPHSGDILYTPPVKEIDSWAPKSPPKAYLVANDSSDRYVEQPVIPRPVPRASLKRKNDQQQQQQQEQQRQQEQEQQQQQQQHTQEQALFLSTPQSPTFVQTPLSPMPPKPLNQPPTPFLPRKKEPDSVPIVSRVRGSPAVGNTAPLSGKGALSSYSDDSNDKIMVASREIVTGNNGGSIIGRGQSKIMSHRESSDFLGRSNLKKVPSALNVQTESSTPPTIPLKSPARRQNSIIKSSYQSRGQQGEGQGSFSQSIQISPTESSQQRQWER